MRAFRIPRAEGVKGKVGRGLQGEEVVGAKSACILRSPNFRPGCFLIPIGSLKGSLNDSCFLLGWGGALMMALSGRRLNSPRILGPLGLDLFSGFSKVFEFEDIKAGAFEV